MGVRDGMNKRIWDGPDFHILTPTKTEKIPVCICNWTSSGDRTQPIHNLTLLQRKMQEKREFWRTFYGIYANSY